MKPFIQFVRDYVPPVHEGAILMPLRDFIDALSLLDAQKTDGERIVEIREDCPEPGNYAVRLMVREQEDETEN